MLDQQVLAGKWNQVRGRIKQRWAALADDDLQAFNGNVDELIGQIQQKTGESRQAIEDFLESAAEGGSQFASRIRDDLEGVADDAAQAAREEREQRHAGYAENMIQSRPAQTMAIAFGAGLVSGLALAALVGSRGRTGRRNAANIERFGRRVLDALTDLVPESLAKH